MEQKESLAFSQIATKQSLKLTEQSMSTQFAAKPTSSVGGTSLRVSRTSQPTHLEPPHLRYVKWFYQIGINDISIVGGKNASLGEMYKELTKHGVRVPNGFAVTSDGYRYFLREAKLDQK